MPRPTQKGRHHETGGHLFGGVFVRVHRCGVRRRSFALNFGDRFGDGGTRRARTDVDGGVSWVGRFVRAHSFAERGSCRFDGFATRLRSGSSTEGGRSCTAEGERGCSADSWSGSSTEGGRGCADSWSARGTEAERGRCTDGGSPCCSDGRGGCSAESRLGWRGCCTESGCGRRSCCTESGCGRRGCCTESGCGRRCGDCTRCRCAGRWCEAADDAGCRAGQ
jgi:hypothetical protein